MSIGIHVLGELYGIDRQTLSYVENIEPRIWKVVQECHLNVLTSAFHQFQPVGVTGFFLLAESHLSLHTWPEKSCLALDVFSCGSAEQAVRAFDAIVRELAPTEVDRRILDRGRLWTSRAVSSSAPYRVVGEACGRS
ncbi:MAG: adenosylmethionine decarboxylase [Acidobacteria bacterium]|nr:MAG: adenosylmethionine decarboxylase [Acidobacteriota bacterium]